jgi:hypothetical protein
MVIQERNGPDGRIVKFSGVVGSSTDISDLKRIIAAAKADGIKRVSLHFPPDSFLNPESIGAVICSAHILHEAGGKLVIVSPTSQMKSIIDNFNLHSYVELLED